MALYSCKEKTTYGTSIVIENQLIDSVYVKLYPKETPYSNMTDYKMAQSDSRGIYWKLGQAKLSTEIINLIFDSITINNNRVFIKFTYDTAIGYKVNPYHEIEAWNSEVQNYDTPDNFNRNPHEDIVFTFILIEDMLLIDEN